MGFDVFGLSPTSSDGEYFRRNNQGWHLLMDVVEIFGPESLLNKCKWRYNFEPGLGAEHAVLLADTLETALRSGRIAAYVGSVKPVATDGLCQINQVVADTLAKEGVAVQIPRAISAFGTSKNLRHSCAHPEASGSADRCRPANSGPEGLQLWILPDTRGVNRASSSTCALHVRFAKSRCKSQGSGHGDHVVPAIARERQEKGEIPDAEIKGVNR